MERIWGTESRIVDAISSLRLDELVSLDLFSAKTSKFSKEPDLRAFLIEPVEGEQLACFVDERKVLGDETDEFRNSHVSESLGYRPVIRLDRLPTTMSFEIIRMIERKEKLREPLIFGTLVSSSIEWEYFEDYNILVAKEIQCSINDWGQTFTVDRKIIDELVYVLTHSHDAEIEVTKEEEQEEQEEEQEQEPEDLNLEENIGLPKVEQMDKAIDRIRAFVDSKIPVFIHGRFGEGKSQRIRQIDPECQVIELCLIPYEDLTGIDVCKNGEVKKNKPTWVEELEKLCEDGKQHILFLDEMTNAVPAIQGAVSSLILRRKVSNTWDLPENVSIVCAGNEIEDSIAANEIPEIVMDRMAHIEVKTTVQEWLEWATQSNIHPAIIAFVTVHGEDALRGTSHIDDIEIDVTPRSWELASKQLYATNDVHDLESILGLEMLSSFISFLQISGITKDDILNGEYTFDEFMSNTFESKVSLASSLARQIDSEEEFKQIREFLKAASEELVVIFDSVWISGDEDRALLVGDLVKEDERDEEYTLKWEDEDNPSEGEDDYIPVEVEEGVVFNPFDTDDSDEKEKDNDDFDSDEDNKKHSSGFNDGEID